MRRKTMLRVTVIGVMLAMLTVVQGAGAFHEGGLVLLNSHTFTWVDPESQGEIQATENVYEGCQIPGGDFKPHDMTFEYVVENISYDPIPGITNGFSGFQILFPQQVPEVYNQLSPAIGGPWQQNAFSGQFPPWGVEWDVPLPNLGIMPGETGTFSYCTYEREDVVVEAPGAGWVHTWGWLDPSGTVVNTQTFLFDVPNSVPGRLYYEAGYSCSDGHEVCKKVKYLDEDYDGLIEVGEPISFLQVIQVHNGTDMVWEDVVVEDRFGAEIGVASADPDRGTVVLETKGKSEKVFLTWTIGDLGPGETANLVLRTYTDLNPAGKQEYSECGYYEYNSGAVLKFRRERGRASYETGEITLSVPC